MRARRNGGFTLVESAVVMLVVSALTLAGLGSLQVGPSRLLVVQHELQASLDQAFELARARGQNITVALGHGAGNGPDVIPVPIPRGVAWGKPAATPLPKGMEAPKVADDTGEAHALITVTPRRTVTAGAWFFHERQEVLCLRLSGAGRLSVLRWRPGSAKWQRVN
jgi:prepilin-type N-terminal cleavage/methylation domain-containing protein